MGELHYSVTESIVLFQLADDMQQTTYGAIKVMVLHEEAIAVKASPPCTAHVRAYMAVVGGEPSRTQPLPSKGEVELHLPTGNAHLGGGTLQHLQADLGDLVDDELHQLMEDLHWEVTLHELNTSPRSHPPIPWGNPVGNGDPNTDDQEVTFLRGGGWVPVGQPFQPLAPTKPDGGGFPWDSLLNPCPTW